MSDYSVTVVDESIAVTVDVTPESTPIVIEMAEQGPPGPPGPPGTTDHLNLSNIGSLTHDELESAIQDRIPYAGAEADIDLGGAQKVINMQDPSADQDAATKKYVDDSVDSREPAITAGTTAQFWRGDKSWQSIATITSGFVPYTGATADLNLGTRNLRMPSGNILDAAGFVALQINNRALQTATGIPNLQWGTYELWDSNLNLSQNWDSRYVYNSSGQQMIGWYGSEIEVNANIQMPMFSLYTGNIYVGAGPSMGETGGYLTINPGVLTPLLFTGYISNQYNQPVFDLDNFTSYDGSFVANVSFGSRQLIDLSGAIVSLDWGQRIGADSSNNQSFNYDLRWLLSGNFTLGVAYNWSLGEMYGYDGDISIGHGNRLLYGTSAAVALNYDLRRLAASTGQYFVDWSTVQQLKVIGSMSLGGSFLTPAAKLHLDSGNAQASALKFTAGTTTGILSSDGFDVGITTAGVAEVRQRENLALELYTSNVLRAQWTGAGNLFLGGTVQARGAAGSAAIPFWGFETSSDCGMYRSTGSSIGLSTSGVARLFLDSAGKVTLFQGTTLRGAMTTVYSQINSVGNVGTGEDNLHSVSIPSSGFAANGDSMEIKAAGTFAANANNKRVKLKFGAVTLFDTTALAFNTGDWQINARIFRTSTTTGKSVVTWTCNNVTLTTTVDYQAWAFNFLTANTLVVTGEATADNDIVQELMQVFWIPVA